MKDEVGELDLRPQDMESARRCVDCVWHDADTTPSVQLWGAIQGAHWARIVACSALVRRD